MGLPTLHVELPRKQRLPWLESRLRRLRCIKAVDLTDRQRARIRELERAIARLNEPRKK